MQWWMRIILLVLQMLLELVLANVPIYVYSTAFRCYIKLSNNFFIPFFTLYSENHLHQHRRRRQSSPPAAHREVAKKDVPTCPKIVYVPSHLPLNNLNKYSKILKTLCIKQSFIYKTTEFPQS
jgi:hypothetical protein